MKLITDSNLYLSTEVCKTKLFLIKFLIQFRKSNLDRDVVARNYKFLKKSNFTVNNEEN